MIKKKTVLIFFSIACSCSAGQSHTTAHSERQRIGPKMLCFASIRAKKKESQKAMAALSLDPPPLERVAIKTLASTRHCWWSHRAARAAVCMHLTHMPWIPRPARCAVMQHWTNHNVQSPDTTLADWIRWLSCRLERNIHDSPSRMMFQITSSCFFAKRDVHNDEHASTYTKRVKFVLIYALRRGWWPGRAPGRRHRSRTRRARG